MKQCHEELVDAAMLAQRQVVQALHAAAEPTWLQLELTMGQVKALFTLADDALTVSQLADRLGIGKPAASILVERLVQLRLVTRTEDQSDRRRTLVRLTAESTVLVEQLREGGQGTFRAWLGQMDDDDLTALVQGLQALSRMSATRATRVDTPA
jgi:DNA-binding MarR family transcriptional regulator